MCGAFGIESVTNSAIGAITTRTCGSPCQWGERVDFQSVQVTTLGWPRSGGDTSKALEGDVRSPAQATTRWVHSPGAGPSSSVEKRSPASHFATPAASWRRGCKTLRPAQTRHVDFAMWIHSKEKKKKKRGRLFSW